MSLKPDKANLERAKALKELKEKLQIYERCAVVRPTGWGKTTMIAKMIKDYNHVLYLYPTEIVKKTIEKVYEEGDLFETEDGSIKVSNAITFITYSKLIRISDFSIYKNVDLIIADECHKLGAERTAPAIKSLLSTCPNSLFVGITATITRMDTVDVLQEFFNGISVYRYTLSDAIRDGIIKSNMSHL